MTAFQHTIINTPVDHFSDQHFFAALATAAFVAITLRCYWGGQTGGATGTAASGSGSLGAGR